MGHQQFISQIQGLRGETVSYAQGRLWGTHSFFRFQILLRNLLERISRVSRSFSWRILTMVNLRHVAVLVPTLALAAAVYAPVQAGAEDWKKTYPVAGKASLALSTGDVPIELHGCAECHAVKIDVDWRDRNPSDFVLKESQTGDMVTFELNEKAKWGIHISAKDFHSPHVTVETPAALDLQAKTSDGAVRISGIEGDVRLHTSDGAVDVEDVNGSLQLVASDGAIKVHNVVGKLDSRSSDGRATIDGKFTELHVHTSDGNLDLTVGEGSKLTAASRIESSDGKVTLHLARALDADLDVHTGDGKINCDLPLKMDGFTTSGSGHNLRGHLNGGGASLAVHTSDGSVTITSL
jgi:DUF4097 and DUF4098 domain-containing protein YvlB